MIRSFHDRRTAALFAGKTPKGVPANLLSVIQRKLERLHDAGSLDDLRAYRGDKLHALEHDRAGQWAIWVNTQFRICFVWRDGGAEEVEFVDYHKG